jgi:hypothetical protein
MKPPPICYNCKHQSSNDPFKCDAFPKGIPAGIINNEIDHREPVAGDRGITFDAIDPNIPFPTIEPEPANSGVIR